MLLLSVYGLCTLNAVTSLASSVNITLLQSTAALDSNPEESRLNTLQHGVIRATPQERHRKIQKASKGMTEIAQ